ncbi:MAG: methylmalonyl-CoA mutase family protein [Kofleriaceae bacterium]|nr:methylmalonyl-CoA mutase family protein [Kofleriaceae bacterium]
MADLTTWRALVEKELAGASFDKLVQRTAEGIALQPLYAERTAEAPFVRDATRAPFKLCMRVAPGGDIAPELEGGAEAIWTRDPAAINAALDRGLVVVMGDGHQGGLDEHAITDGDEPDDADEDEASDAANVAELWSSFDVIGDAVRDPSMFDDAAERDPLVPIVRDAIAEDPEWRCIRVTTLPFHERGADAADELALGLSSLVATLRQLDAAAIDLSRASRLMWAQIAVGRDTFGELCKLRALRVLWHKVLAASGITDGKLDAIHAVCSERTMSTRDPWVNMLRVTTQVFAAALGGAHLITPLPFDAAFANPSALGQRVARNTALVLREESQLGRVIDAAGGSYYIEARTDALAREAWSRFNAIEREGGIVELLRTGALQARLDAAWKQRAAAIAKRKEPVLGVTEFANLRETLPGTPSARTGVHRDSEAFEALRTRVEAAPREVALIQLGPPAEHRARVGFAEGFFAVAGIAAKAGQIASGLDVACICGADERYATEAADTARALKAAGTNRVVLAGRPGALEAELKAAGVDAFIFVGCDVLGTLEDLLV